MRGQLILIEGLDRSGKSTQAQVLADRLNGLRAGSECALFKFPDRSTATGKIINRYLTDPAFSLPDQVAHLLFSANRWERARELRELLQNGHFVVMDRYVYSGIAYSLAKLLLLTQADSGTSLLPPPLPSAEMSLQRWLQGPDAGLPKPDLTLLLTLDVDTISQRKGWGEERYELLEFQKRVKACFLSILDPHIDQSICILDVNNLSIDQVSEKIWTELESRGVNRLTSEPILVLFSDM